MGYWNTGQGPYHLSQHWRTRPPIHLTFRPDARLNRDSCAGDSRTGVWEKLRLGQTGGSDGDRRRKVRMSEMGEQETARFGRGRGEYGLERMGFLFIPCSSPLFSSSLCTINKHKHLSVLSRKRYCVSISPPYILFFLTAVMLPFSFPCWRFSPPLASSSLCWLLLLEDR